VFASGMVILNGVVVGLLAVGLFGMLIMILKNMVAST
jgi:preprotein translocase subunit Sss1